MTLGVRSTGHELSSSGSAITKRSSASIAGRSAAYFCSTCRISSCSVTGGTRLSSSVGHSDVDGSGMVSRGARRGFAKE